VKEVFAERGDEIAALIVEPVTGNMNCILPEPGFLEGLRDVCNQYRSLLIFDEVMTGFRVALGGAQSVYNVTPDLTMLGKVIGGGMPVGAFGGRADIMDQLSPDGPVYHAGTLSGNPVAMTAGLTTLELIAEPEFFVKLSAMTHKLVFGITEMAKEAGIPLTANELGGMFGLFFTDVPQVTRYEQVTACDMERFRRFFHGMLAEGVYMAPAAFEAGFVSAAHDDAIIDRTLEAASRVLRIL